MSAQTDVKPTFKEVSESMTGFEDLAIEAAFHTPTDEVLQSTRAARAFLFILRKRDGMKNADAFREVMEMRLADVMSHFDVKRSETEVDGLGEASEPESTEPGLSS